MCYLALVFIVLCNYHVWVHRPTHNKDLSWSMLTEAFFMSISLCNKRNDTLCPVAMTLLHLKLRDDAYIVKLVYLTYSWAGTERNIGTDCNSLLCSKHAEKTNRDHSQSAQICFVI